MLAYHAALLGLLVGTTLLGTVLGILNVRHGAREVRANGEWLTDQLGIDEPTDATYAGLFVGLLAVYPLVTLTAPLSNRLSLAHEREADTFAVKVMGDSEPMADALAGLARENLANPFPHPWYAAFNHRHPPIPERMRYVRTVDSAEKTDVENAQNPA